MPYLCTIRSPIGSIRRLKQTIANREFYWRVAIVDGLDGIRPDRLAEATRRLTARRDEELAYLNRKLCELQQRRDKARKSRQ